jgi:hypothetical protein
MSDKERRRAMSNVEKEKAMSNLEREGYVQSGGGVGMRSGRKTRMRSNGNWDRRTRLQRARRRWGSWRYGDGVTAMVMGLQRW